jgi:SAM-dependent methyltransferase
MLVPRDSGALRAQVRESYATAEALAAYGERVDRGLRIWEAAVVRDEFPPRGRVLTIGCGAGREAFALERLGYETHGVDISGALLGIAAEMRERRGHRTSLCRIDGETLPFDRGAFDVVTLWAQMLDNVPSRAGRLALMREVRRVLVPDGIATFSAHDDERTRPEMDPADVVLADLPEQGDLLRYERREAATRYCHLFQREELVDLVQGAGFTDARIRHTSDLGEEWGNVFVVTCRR